MRKARVYKKRILHHQASAHLKSPFDPKGSRIRGEYDHEELRFSFFTKRQNSYHFFVFVGKLPWRPRGWGRSSLREVWEIAQLSRRIFVFLISNEILLIKKTSSHESPWVREREVPTCVMRKSRWEKSWHCYFLCILGNKKFYVFCIQTFLRF